MTFQTKQRLRITLSVLQIIFALGNIYLLQRQSKRALAKSTSAS